MSQTPARPGALFTASIVTLMIAGSFATVFAATPVLTSIRVSLPVAPGEEIVFRVDGFDQFNAPFVLPNETESLTAPTAAGPGVVSFTHANVTGELAVHTAVGKLTSVLITGPDTLAANATDVTYYLTGLDQYGNVMPLPSGATEMLFDAPTEAGAAVVEYKETIRCSQGLGIRTLEARRCPSVKGTKDITIVADETTLSGIVIGGPASMPALATQSFPILGLDAFGNPYALAGESVEYTSGFDAGTVTLEYEYDVYDTSRPLIIEAHPMLVSIVVADEPNAQAALENGVSGSGHVDFPRHPNEPLTQPDVRPANGATIQVFIVRTARLVGSIDTTVVDVVADANGDFTWTSPQTASTPGDYIVIVQATWFGHLGDTSARYSIGP